MAANIAVTYSASCLPPKEVFNHMNGSSLQSYSIRFPTFFGRSIGFVKLNDSWKSEFRKMRVSRPVQPVSKIGPLASSKAMKICDTNENAKTNCRHSGDSFALGARRAGGHAHAAKLPAEKKERDCHSLHRKSHGSAHPLNFHPRIHSRSLSQSKQLMSDATDLSKLYSFGETETNCNNCVGGGAGPHEDEWIELFFEFPNGFRQRFHMRYQAIFKNAVKAFTARMGYRSINDLVFLTAHKKTIFINDTPKSIGLREGDVIRVSNFNFDS